MLFLVIVISYLMFQLQLRQSFTNEGHDIPDTFGNSGNDNEDNAYDTGIPDFGQPDEEISEYMKEDLAPPLHGEVGRLVFLF